MTRTELEQYLGKEVEVTLYDGTIVQGVLHKTGEKKFQNDSNLFIPKNYYFCESEQNKATCIFRVSHIEEIKEIWKVHYE